MKVGVYFLGRENSSCPGRYEGSQHTGRSRSGLRLLGRKTQRTRRAGSRFQRPCQQFLGHPGLFCVKLLAALFLSYSAVTKACSLSAGPPCRPFAHTTPLLGVSSPHSCQYTPASSRTLCHSLVLKESVPSLNLSHRHSISQDVVLMAPRRTLPLPSKHSGGLFLVQKVKHSDMTVTWHRPLNECP